MTALFNWLSWERIRLWRSKRDPIYQRVLSCYRASLDDGSKEWIIKLESWVAEPCKLQFTLGMLSCKPGFSSRKHDHYGATLRSFIFSGSYIEYVGEEQREFKAPTFRWEKIDEHKIYSPNGFRSMHLFTLYRRKSEN